MTTPAPPAPSWPHAHTPSTRSNTIKRLDRQSQRRRTTSRATSGSLRRSILGFGDLLGSGCPRCPRSPSRTPCCWDERPQRARPPGRPTGDRCRNPRGHPSRRFFEPLRSAPPRTLAPRASSGHARERPRGLSGGTAMSPAPAVYKGRKREAVAGVFTMKHCQSHCWNPLTSPRDSRCVYPTGYSPVSP